MISAMFTFGTETVLVVVKGNDVTFGNTSYGAQMAPLKGLRLDKLGVAREFPNLKDNPAWREEAIKRFSEKIKTFTNETAVLDYIISDLRKYGYKPMYKQIQGHRKEVIK
jgi:hypothetical protein